MTKGMLSVCVTVKNRSRVLVDGRELLLFPNCVRSLVQSAPERLACELVVSDWASDDWPLEEWIHEAAGRVPVRVVQVDGTFSRGRGRNAAAAAAQGDMLYFTDADALLSPEVFKRGVKAVKRGKAFFPVHFGYASPEHDDNDGYWRTAGYGNCIVSRDTFDRSGGWPDYDHWGNEDNDFHARVSRLAEIVREEVPGMRHQWHPDDIQWKDRYGKLPEVLRSLADVVPPDQSFILVDEGRFEITDLDGRPALRFFERNGWLSTPPDDLTAIRQLEHLRSEGAGYLVFGSVAFSWFERYAVFNDYLRSRFPLILDDDDLKVFEL